MYSLLGLAGSKLYMVAHPESLECMVDVAELGFELFPSELLLLDVSKIPAQIYRERICEKIAHKTVSI
jgi:hypothetical protein